MEMNCNKCNYFWKYKGSNPYYCTCPYCHSKVKTGRKLWGKLQRNNKILTKNIVKNSKLVAL